MTRDQSLWRGPGSRSFKQRSAALRKAAMRNPDARCWLCGKTLAEGPRHRNGRPAFWHADHVIPGDPGSPLRLAHSTCNQSKGGGHGGGLPSVWPPSPNA
jgi:hypothetical protein